MKVSPETSVKPATAFNLTAEEAQLLLRLTLTAIGRARFNTAEKLLTLLEQFRPNDDALTATRCIFYISKGDFLTARTVIETMYQPPNCAPLLTLFYVITLIRLREPYLAQSLLHSVLQQTNDPNLISFAHNLYTETTHQTRPTPLYYP